MKDFRIDPGKTVTVHVVAQQARPLPGTVVQGMKYSPASMTQEGRVIYEQGKAVEGVTLTASAAPIDPAALALPRRGGGRAGMLMGMQTASVQAASARATSDAAGHFRLENLIGPNGQTGDRHARLDGFWHDRA